MFGHDEHNDNDDNGQINLPVAGGFGQDDNNNDNQSIVGGAPDAPQQTDTELGNLEAVLPRKAQKSGAPTDELLDIKQDALQALTPLIDHLEQNPVEKFRTTMMMIQASDNHGLIKMAYEAAQQIENDKERAQALLDIVNEINYFTQQNQA
ncbi:MAG: bifunctional phosphoglucose/phosphomannose isomerase [Candidatus Saccharibacteria bacterium]|nr:bifunctional phosphoglucose/phosphomannose isomerase [Candidatus Saccharibacteria bacterium]